MDSAGNSGSLQSSSGAEEECDSRAALHDSLLTTHYQPHQPPPSFNHHMFDQNQLNNINPLLFTPSPQHQLLNQLHSNVWTKTLPSFSPVTTTEPNPPPPAARNPKKRSRASRRAPTTVLTTDTNNFRAMVQEFTGIPAPPFTSSSPAFPRLTASFDIFGRPSASAMMRSNVNNFDNLPQLPPYVNLVRPFPQMIQSASLLDSSDHLNTMQQNTFTFPSNSLNQLPTINAKTTQNDDVSSDGFGVIGQTMNHEATPTITTASTDQVASGNWDGGNGKGTSGMKGDQGLVEPWICPSD